MLAAFSRSFAEKMPTLRNPVELLVRHYSPAPLTFIALSQIILHLEQTKFLVSFSLILSLFLSQCLHVGQHEICSLVMKTMIISSPEIINIETHIFTKNWSSNDS